MHLKTIEGLNRIGEENAFAVLARAKALAAQGMDIINLGIGQPDFATPEHIVEAAIKALRDGAHGYTDARGITQLREAVACDIDRRLAVAVNPDNVLIVPGGKMSMYLAITLFGQAGAEIMYPDPGFPIYRSMIEYTGAKPVPIPIEEKNGFAFDAQQALDLINDKTSLIILNSPANPCGGVTPKAEIDKLVKGLSAHPNAAILSDEIYAQMTYDDAQHVSLLSYPEIRDRIILLDGWSKTYAMTGWRMGYSVWPNSLYNHVRKIAVNAWSCVNAPTQWAGIAALQGDQDCVAQMMAAFDRRRFLIVEGLNAIDGLSCIKPKGAFYAFANVTALKQPAKTLANALLEQAGVATIAGPDFGTLGEGYIRLSYANSLENIEQALIRISDFCGEINSKLAL